MTNLPTQQFRDMLLEFNTQGFKYLGETSGQKLVEVIRKKYATAITARARRFGYPMDEEEALHTILINLIEQNGRIIKLVAKSADPYAYLGVCVKKWGAAQWCLRPANITLDTVSLFYANPENTQTKLTPLEDVITLTTNTLQSQTPQKMQQLIQEPITWLALNPPQRLSYEGQDITAAAKTFTQFTHTQITAIAHACWGTRPRQKETSLFGAYLTNPHFNPYTSASHSAALIQYKTLMQNQTALEKYLTAPVKT